MRKRRGRGLKSLDSFIKKNKKQQHFVPVHWRFSPPLDVTPGRIQFLICIKNITRPVKPGPRRRFMDSANARKQKDDWLSACWEIPTNLRQSRIRKERRFLLHGPAHMPVVLAVTWNHLWAFCLCLTPEFVKSVQGPLFLYSLLHQHSF